RIARLDPPSSEGPGPSILGNGAGGGRREPKPFGDPKPPIFGLCIAPLALGSAIAYFHVCPTFPILILSRPGLSPRPALFFGLCGDYFPLCGAVRNPFVDLGRNPRVEAPDFHGLGKLLGLCQALKVVSAKGNALCLQVGSGE